MFYQVSLFMLGLLIGCTGCNQFKDDTDPANGISGMTPLTDNATGCQYLSRSARSGTSITPRIAADGHSHMGCKGDKP